MTGVERLRALAGAWDEWGLGGAIAEIADEIELEHDAAVADSPYDAILPEDREAIAWVREHGGIEGLSRLFQDADNRRVELCAALGIDLDKGWSEAMAAMRLRLIPEGCEWPRYESGDLVMFGDCVENRNGTCTVNSVRFYSGGGVSVYGEDRGAQFVVVTEPVMRDPIRKARPKVFAADGEPLEVGQTVWDVLGNRRFKVLGFGSDAKLGEFTVETVGIDGMSLRGYSKPSDLTHQRPVLDADGIPIREGDMVYDKDTGDRFEVDGFSYDFVVCTDVDACESDIEILPSQLTHTKPEPPDSWERIEDDATLSPEVYCHRNGIDISQKDGTEIFLADTVEPMARDLVRRCRALAERERGE